MTAASPAEGTLIVRRALDGRPWLQLEPLDEEGPPVNFSLLPAGLTIPKDALQVAVVIPGTASHATFAVTAEWQVDDPTLRSRFEDSRRELFQLRAEHLPGFVGDWLLAAHDRSGLYVVLGLYSREEDLRAARSHPEVEAFSIGRPAEKLGARALGDTSHFRVLRRSESS